MKIKDEDNGDFVTASVVHMITFIITAYVKNPEMLDAVVRGVAGGIATGLTIAFPDEEGFQQALKELVDNVTNVHDHILTAQEADNEEQSSTRH